MFIVVVLFVLFTVNFDAVFVIRNLFKGTVQIYVQVLNYMYKKYDPSCNLVTNQQIKCYEMSCCDVVSSNALLLCDGLMN